MVMARWMLCGALIGALIVLIPTWFYGLGIDMTSWTAKSRGEWSFLMVIMIGFSSFAGLGLCHGAGKCK